MTKRTAKAGAATIGGMTQAAYARHRHCDPREVRRALKAGRITLEADGTIDAAKADKEWAASANPASASKPGLKPVSADAIAAARDVLRAAGEKVATGTMTFTEARTASEIVKAQMGALRLKERQGALIDRARTADAVFALARQFRDNLQSFPAQVAALMAAEIGVDPHLMEASLDKFIRGHLSALAAVNPDAVLASLARGKTGRAP